MYGPESLDIWDIWIWTTRAPRKPRNLIPFNLGGVPASNPTEPRTSCDHSPYGMWNVPFDGPYHCTGYINIISRRRRSKKLPVLAVLGLIYAGLSRIPHVSRVSLFPISLSSPSADDSLILVHPSPPIHARALPPLVAQPPSAYSAVPWRPWGLADQGASLN